MESVQYRAALEITGAIKGTQLKPYKELGLETLKFRWCWRRLCMFYKFKMCGIPLYQSKYILEGNNNTWLNGGGPKAWHYRTDVFKYSFFPYAISECNELDLQIRKANSLLSFKNALLKLYITPWFITTH